MGNFAENLNLGNRVRPPPDLVNIPLIKRKEKVYMDYNPIESYFETQSVIKA